MSTPQMYLQLFLVVSQLTIIQVYSASINKYGRLCSFAEAKGYVLHGNDNLILRMISLEDCQTYCAAQSDPECLSLEYDKEENCYLSANSNRTKPMDFTRNANADYYENSCTRNVRPKNDDHINLMECPSDYFGCTFDTHVCIPESWTCDKYPDCSDESDELQCPMANGDSSDTFVCMSTGLKIPADRYCNGEADCQDNSDEDDCATLEEDSHPLLQPSCYENEFTCPGESVCKSLDWLCDGENDCQDGYDELDCESVDEDVDDEDEEEFEEVDGEQRNTRCNFFCIAGRRGRCLPRSQVCDGVAQCGNGADELRCDNACNDMIHFTCKEQREPYCVPKFFTCDGVNDCADGSDEENCEDGGYGGSCSPLQFQCANKYECEFISWVCDGEADCEDGSDEINCSAANCSATRQFTCKSDGLCIPHVWRCDEEEDCKDGSDEKGCGTAEDEENCDPDFTCKESGSCINKEYICDGDKDCPDGSDEEYCNGDCDWSSEKACKSGKECIPKNWWCDGTPDCGDSSDEGDCD